MTTLKEQLEQLAPSSTENATTPEPNFDDVELTQEETAEAIRLAKAKKYIELRKQEYFEAISKQPVFYRYTAQELYRALKQTRSATGRAFVVDDDNLETVKQLCFYFSADERFNGDLQKGLMLMGNLGTGKTHLMAFFQQNQHASFSVAKTRTIENAWINEPKPQPGDLPGNFSTIDYYSYNRVLAVNENRFGHQVSGFCFDDLGSESLPSKRYGEEKNVIAEILLNRYDNKLPFNTTHITTNLLPEELEKLYGVRLRERLKEMCNVITFNGGSRR